MQQTALAKARLRVSDHALCRWLERIHGIDMEYLRREFLSEAAKVVGEMVPAGEFVVTLRGGSRFAVRDGSIMTILDDRYQPPRGKDKSKAREAGIPAPVDATRLLAALRRSTEP